MILNKINLRLIWKQLRYRKMDKYPRFVVKLVLISNLPETRNSCNVNKMTHLKDWLFLLAPKMTYRLFKLAVKMLNPMLLNIVGTTESN